MYIIGMNKKDIKYIYIYCKYRLNLLWERKKKKKIKYIYI